MLLELFVCKIVQTKGISQRDCRSFYHILIEHRADLLARIKHFYSQNIHKRFYDASYVFDVCLGKVSLEFRLYIII